MRKFSKLSQWQQIVIVVTNSCCNLLPVVSVYSMLMLQLSSQIRENALSLGSSQILRFKINWDGRSDLDHSLAMLPQTPSQLGSWKTPPQMFRPVCPPWACHFPRCSGRVFNSYLHEILLLIIIVINAKLKTNIIATLS